MIFISRNLLKNIPGIRVLANLYRGLKFLRRVISLRFKLKTIDSKLPFGGKLSEEGYTKFTITENTLDTLRLACEENQVSTNGMYANVSLPEKCAGAIEEIFDFAGREAKAYLGPTACLDGINWMVSTAKTESISGNWHTDNVGSRLKLFVCIYGDGSQPTFIRPTKNRIPTLHSWATNTAIEAYRWFGLSNNRRLKNEVHLEHKHRTAFLFDTQLLHRGGYEKGASKRIIFHMEFSNPEKHEISRGPIGSKSFNTFQFDPKLLNINSFKNVLDSKRIHQSGNYLSYGLSNDTHNRH